MSWVNDLASVLGIPGGAATLGVAMYLGCSAAEKVARPEALADIGRVLKDPSWSRSVRPSAIIERVFVWTFGERHLSRKCIRRSGSASILVVISIALVGTARHYVHTGDIDIQIPTPKHHEAFAVNYVMGLLGGVFPDYVALGKGRLLIGIANLIDGMSAVVVLIASDIALSCLISLFTSGFVFLCYTTGGEILFHAFSVAPLAATERLVTDTGALVWAYVVGRTPLPVFGVVFLSTLFTSIWTTLILLSTATIKLLAPLQRFTGWFFDVENHPVQAIATVAGALVMSGGLIWTVLRAVI